MCFFREKRNRKELISSKNIPIFTAKKLVWKLKIANYINTIHLFI